MIRKTILILIFLLISCPLLSVSPFSAQAQSQTMETRIYEVDTQEDLFDHAPNEICAGWIGPNPDDFGECSLRAAITEATYTYGDPAIVHIKLPPGTYKLSIKESPFNPPPPDGSDDKHYGDLDLPEEPNGNLPNDVIIEGTGGPDNPSVIDADFIDRVLEVGPNRSLTLKNVILKNGLIKGETDEEARGGGIAVRYDSTLNLDHVRLSNNGLVCIQDTACNFPEGSAIHSENANLSLNNVEIDNNSAAKGSTIRFWDGTGERYKFTFSIMDSAIHHNTLAYHTIRANGSLFLTNSTLTDNVITDPAPDIFSEELFLFGRLLIQNSTIVIDGKRAVISGNSDVLIKNSILLQKTDENSALCTLEINSNGGNIFSDNSCNPDTSLGDLVLPYAQARLDTLRDNGGPTPTIALLNGSAAINRIAGQCKMLIIESGAWKEVPLTHDQRGEPRDDGFCDSGAFESEQPLSLFLPVIIK